MDEATKTLGRKWVPRAWWGWVALAAVFLTLRVGVGGWIHPAFNTDESLVIEYAGSAGHPALEGDYSLSWRPIVGLRLWWLRAWKSIPGLHFPQGPVLSAATFSLLGLSLWVFFVWKRLSRSAAWWMAAALAVGPPAGLYYSTLHERRMETLLWSALLALGAGSWTKNPGRVFALGLLTAWGCSCEPFFIFFLIPVLWYEKFKQNTFIRDHWMKLFCFALAGLILGMIPALVWEHQWPSFPSGHLTWTWAGWKRFSINSYILSGIFPQFWMGNCPFGFLQNTQLGEACFHFWTGSRAVALGVIFWMAAGFAAYGLAGCGRRGKEESAFSIMMALPGVLLVLFFLFSHQTWAVPSLRYLHFLVVPWSAGFGLGIVSLGKRHPKTARILAAFFLATMGGIFVARVEAMNGKRPSEVIARGLEEMGVRAGYAHYWVADAVRIETGDRIALLPYNGEPPRRSVYRKVWTSPVLAWVSVEGLDDPGLGVEVNGRLAGEGYRPVGFHRFPDGWSVTEYQKVIQPDHGGRMPNEKGNVHHIRGTGGVR